MLKTPTNSNDRRTDRWFGLLIECIYLRQFILRTNLSICGISMELNRICEHQLWGNNFNSQIEISKGNSSCKTVKMCAPQIYTVYPNSMFSFLFYFSFLQFEIGSLILLSFTKCSISNCNNCFNGKTIWYLCVYRTVCIFSYAIRCSRFKKTLFILSIYSWLAMFLRLLLWQRSFPCNFFFRFSFFHLLLFPFIRIVSHLIGMEYQNAHKLNTDHRNTAFEHCIFAPFLPSLLLSFIRFICVCFHFSWLGFGYVVH